MLSMTGRDVYKKPIKGYTEKQWRSVMPRSAGINYQAYFSPLF